jgi:UDP-2-acetamido-2-deoxy-ribo-hexuluronate aminotransferase
MQFIDLAAQQARIKDKIDAGIQRVLAHGKYIMGPEVFELEERLADYVGVKHCISCASGTDALLMSLMAQGVGPGDAVFTTPFTFVATGEVISLLGATPVFVDIDPRTFNIDAEKLEQAVENLSIVDSRSSLVTSDQQLTPKGVIPVDLFGLPADYDAINAVAQKYGLFVLEDAAQGFGGTYKGRKAGSLGDVAATSFFPAKPLGCYGDGGAVFTDDDSLAEVLKSIRIHGKGQDKYDNIRIGINGRLDTLQAAILLPKLEIFPEEVQARQKAAERYSELFSALTNDQRPATNNYPPATSDQRLTTPFVPNGLTSAWAQYSILLAGNKQRSDLQKHLSDSGIPTAIYYPRSLHLQTAYAWFGYQRGDFPVSEDVSERILSLPMGPYAKEEDQVRVVKAVIEALN